jgi:hypothetical protein
MELGDVELRNSAFRRWRGGIFGGRHWIKLGQVWPHVRIEKEEERRVKFSCVNISLSCGLTVRGGRTNSRPVGNVYAPHRSSNFLQSTMALSRLLRPLQRAEYICEPCHSFSTSSIAFSGHNKWSTIKHDKARNDKAKSKERAMVGKEIASATQSAYIIPLYNMHISNSLY